MQATTTTLSVANQARPTGATATRTIALRPRRTARQKPPRRPPSILSWDGLEHYRDQVRAVAHEIAESDAAVRATARSVVATGMICAAIRDPSTAPTAEVARAARAQASLRDLMGMLVQEHNVEWDLVRREWAVILDPRPEEAERCDRILAEHAARRRPRKRTRSSSATSTTAAAAAQQAPHSQ
ncbi:hypothetical protein psal_cds_1092 [Pandoravirus salinus]|uniref:Uncharacterized protein n=1 Tax=Pandoravirus salinus TaxID=1349410 RepID=S4VXA3_9VIRU|nr:hypothetical protein psal_cds_1092 [Pandoravirus salinus]AGO85309.1 hypothetical protein psal_cds_1092 [Pandoravirus salinus]